MQIKRKIDGLAKLDGLTPEELRALRRRLTPHEVCRERLEIEEGKDDGLGQ